jgi:hypothetical protein
MKIKNWKTTVGGLIVAVGTYLTGVPELEAVGKGLVMAGTVILAWFAKDNNVSGAGA